MSTTTTDTLALLVASKVMGWEHVDYGADQDAIGQAMRDGPSVTVMFCDVPYVARAGGGFEPWRPDEDWGQAGEVVEAMEELASMYRHADGSWTVRLSVGGSGFGYEKGVTARAETFPLAATLAALKAVGYDPEER